MKAYLAYVVARFDEPGSKRSLAVILFALKGIAPETTVALLELAIVLLAGWSFLQPEGKSR